MLQISCWVWWCKDFWKSINVWRSYGQESNVSFFNSRCTCTLRWKKLQCLNCQKTSWGSVAIRPKRLGLEWLLRWLPSAGGSSSSCAVSCTRSFVATRRSTWRIPFVLTVPADPVPVSSRHFLPTIRTASSTDQIRRACLLIRWSLSLERTAGGHSCDIRLSVVRTSVSDRRTFLGLRSICSGCVTTFMGITSAIGQPTRPTQPFILPGSINE